MSFDSTLFFVRHRRALIEYAVGITGSRAQAEDLVQEAWMRWDGAVGKRAISEPQAYLFRIVRNLAVDKRSATVREAGLVAADGLDRYEGRLSHYAGPTPEGVALYRDELRQLLRAMDELPERTRIAFQMHRLGGYKLREIAAHLNVSLPLAHTLVVDGLEHCKARLGWITPGPKR